MLIESIIARSIIFKVNVVPFDNFFKEWCALPPLEKSFHGWPPAMRSMRPRPVVKVLPLLELPFNLWITSFDRCIKLDPIRSLRSLDLAVQVRRVWPNWAELDGMIHQRTLEGRTEELSAAVGLYALDREWKLFQNMLL
jgi:hypothetical protein